MFCEKCGAVVTANFCPNCGAPTKVPDGEGQHVTGFDINEPNVEYAEQYLAHVYQLEKERYCLRLLEDWLTGQLAGYDKIPLKAVKSIAEKRVISLRRSCLLGGILGAGLGVVVGGVLSFFWHGAAHSVVFALLFGLFAGAAGGVLLTRLLYTYFKRHVDENYQEYASALSKYNEKIRRANYQIRRVWEQQREILSAELCGIREAREAVEHMLQLYYEKDIVLPSYRGLIPISSIYQYYLTGRCVSLRVAKIGHEGAYNLYEREMRQDAFVSGFPEAEKRVEEMRRGEAGDWVFPENQRLFCDAVTDGQERFTLLADSISAALFRPERSKMAASYCEQIAETVEAAGAWLECA